MTRARFAPIFVLLAAGPAIAQPDVSPTRWSVTPLVGTDAGLDVAAGIQVETPIRLRIMVTGGEMPVFYAWGLKKYFQAVKTAPDAMGELLQDLLQNTFVTRANLTWRPLANHGFFFGGGYTLQIADKNGIVSSTIEDATGEQLPASDRGTVRRFSTNVHAQMADGLVGWQWGLSRGFTLRATAGVLVIVSTNTTFTPQYTPADPNATAAFTSFASRKVHDAGVGLVAPEGSLYVGYTF